MQWQSSGLALKLTATEYVNFSKDTTKMQGVFTMIFVVGVPEFYCGACLPRSDLGQAEIGG